MVKKYHDAVYKSERRSLGSVPLLHGIYLETFQLELLLHDLELFSAREPLRGSDNDALWLFIDAVDRK